MRVRSKNQRRQTPAAGKVDARGKALVALSAAAGIARDSAVETVKGGVSKVSERLGKYAGAGLAVVATEAAGAVGYHPSALIAAGAATAGMAIGGAIAKSVNTGLGRLGRGGTGAIATVMADLSRVLQTIEQAVKSANETINTINKTQAYVQRAGQGTGNSLLRSANQRCREAPRHVEEGLNDLRAAEDLVGQHLVKVAKTGR